MRPDYSKPRSLILHLVYLTIDIPSGPSFHIHPRKLASYTVLSILPSVAGHTKENRPTGHGKHILCFSLLSPPSLHHQLTWGKGFIRNPELNCGFPQTQRVWVRFGETWFEFQVNLLQLLKSQHRIYCFRWRPNGIWSVHLSFALGLSFK